MKTSFVLPAFLLFGCNLAFEGIITVDKLTEDELQHISQLGLLDSSEHIILFDSQSSRKVSGNFFTNRRVAAYWQRDDHPEKNQKHSANYHEISGMEYKCTHEYWDLASPIQIFTIHEKTFNIYLDDTKKNEEIFYTRLQEEWNRQKNLR